MYFNDNIFHKSPYKVFFTHQHEHVQNMAFRLVFLFISIDVFQKPVKQSFWKQLMIFLYSMILKGKSWTKHYMSLKNHEYVIIIAM